MPDDGTDSFEGIDLLDPTKLVPEELAPVQLVGKLTLNRQPDELLRRDRAGRLPHRAPRARHRGHQRPAAAGPAVLLPRHAADPPRRPELHPAADQPAALPGQRHAARRHAPDRGPHRPGALPAQQHRRRRAAASPTPPRAATCRSPARSRAPSCGPARRRSTTTSPRPTMFYRSLTPLEQAHIVEAFTFELGKCYEQAIKERELAGPGQRRRRPVRAGRRRPGLARPDGSPAADVALSPALSQIVTEPGPDRRPQDRRHRRCGLRPGRHRQAPEGGGRSWALPSSSSPPSAASWAAARAGVSRRPDAADRALDRVRRARRRGRHRPRPATSSWRCCCRRRSGTARRSPPGVTGQRSWRRPGLARTAPAC